MLSWTKLLRMSFYTNFLHKSIPELTTKRGTGMTFLKCLGLNSFCVYIRHNEIKEVPLKAACPILVTSSTLSSVFFTRERSTTCCRAFWASSTRSRWNSAAWMPQRVLLMKSWREPSVLVIWRQIHINNSNHNDNDIQVISPTGTCRRNNNHKNDTVAIMKAIIAEDNKNEDGDIMIMSMISVLMMKWLR